MTVPGAIFTKNQDPTGYALRLSVASFSAPPQLMPFLQYATKGLGKSLETRCSIPRYSWCDYIRDVMHSVGALEVWSTQLTILYNSQFCIADMVCHWNSFSNSPSVFCPTIACYTPQHHGAEETKQAHLTKILKAAFILGICSILLGIEWDMYNTSTWIIILLELCTTSSSLSS